MILTKSVLIKMNSKWISKYKKIGYNCKVNDIIEISMKDVPTKSHALVKVKCDICGNEKELKYQVYNKNFLNQGYYACSIKCGLGKYEKNMMDRYGVTNYAKTEECRIKTEKTCLIKYGEIVPSRNKSVMDKMQKTRVINGLQNPDSDLDEFNLYKKLVRILTQRNKKLLLENWNGFDYYDNEYIKYNFNYNSNSKFYPTIDHRISVYYGFINKIEPNIISDMDNLCITKRSINSSKNTKNTWII